MALPLAVRNLHRHPPQRPRRRALRPSRQHRPSQSPRPGPPINHKKRINPPQFPPPPVNSPSQNRSKQGPHLRPRQKPPRPTGSPTSHIKPAIRVIQSGLHILRNRQRPVQSNPPSQPLPQSRLADHGRSEPARPEGGNWLGITDSFSPINEAAPPVRPGGGTGARISPLAGEIRARDRTRRPDNTSAPRENRSGFAGDNTSTPEENRSRPASRRTRKPPQPAAARRLTSVNRPTHWGRMPNTSVAPPVITSAAVTDSGVEIGDVSAPSGGSSTHM